MSARLSITLGTALVLAATAGFGQTVREVSELPDWKVKVDGPEEVVQVGETLSFVLSARDADPGLDSAEHVFPDHEGRLLLVQEGRPVTITVSAARGYPVVMIADGPVHGTLQSRSADPSDTGDLAPGNPIAFAVGEDATVILSVTPAHDAVWQVWTWVRIGPLDPTEPFDPNDPALAPLLAPLYDAGYTVEQIEVMFSPPAILEVWDR